MSIVNEPKYKNGVLAAIRDQLEHRALWMYLLCDEAAKKGILQKGDNFIMAGFGGGLASAANLMIWE